MKLKIVKTTLTDKPSVFGLNAVPERYRDDVVALVAKWEHMLDPLLPVSVDELVDRIRHSASDLEETLDAGALEEYGQMAATAFQSQGRTLYRLETSFMP